jgi:gas vesicle protein
MSERIYYSQDAAEEAKRSTMRLVTFAFAVGAGIGALVTLLMSPVSGSEVRKELSSTFEDGVQTSKSAIGDTVQEAKRRVS